VRLFPKLLNYGPDMAGHQLHLYAWLQYGSSVVGLAAVLAAIALWLHHAPRPQPPPPRRIAPAERALWIVLYLTLPLALAGLALLALLHRHVPLFSGSALDSLGAAGMRDAAVSLVLISALIRARLTP
jgi:hypothetical protein